MQERRITPLGESVEVDVDVRIVAATNRDLRDEVDAGRFREDLYYRLAVVTIEMPPLRDRREDLPALIDHFLDRSARAHGVTKPVVPRGLARRLLDHSWPGNVRELANTIERLVVLADNGSASTDDLPTGFAEPPSSEAFVGRHFALPPSGVKWDEVERSFLAQALEMTNGNRKRAAGLLGMPYKTFLYRLEKFGVVHR